MNTEKQVEKIVNRIHAQNNYGIVEMYYSHDYDSDELMDWDYIEEKEELKKDILALINQEKQEMIEFIADGLAHLPIHGDIELMDKEIKGFRKEVLELRTKLEEMK